MATTRQEKGKTGDIVFNLINYTVFTIFTIACIYPFYYLFINTISENSLVQRGLITFIPRGIHLTNYVALAEVNELGTSFLVTVARTVIGTGLMVVVSAFAGYLVTRREMQHRTFWYRFLIITMYFNAGLIPWYLTMSMLGLTNNFLGYIIPTIVAPFNVILVKTYVESIPVELEESAFIDGAGYLKVFRYIIWPLSKPILATIAVFGAVGHWNSFMDSLILMQGAPHLQTVQHRLFNYLNQNTNLEAIMGRSGMVQDMLNTKVIKYTISMVTIIPILMVYPYMQKYFERGIMLGAVKG